MAASAVFRAMGVVAIRRFALAAVVASIASAGAPTAALGVAEPAHCEPVVFEPLEYDGAYIDVGPCTPPPGGAMSVWIELYSPTNGYYKEYVHGLIEEQTDFVNGGNVGLAPGDYRLIVRTTDGESDLGPGGLTLRTEATGTVISRPAPTAVPAPPPTPVPAPPATPVPPSVPAPAPSAPPTPVLDAPSSEPTAAATSSQVTASAPAATASASEPTGRELSSPTPTASTDFLGARAEGPPAPALAPTSPALLLLLGAVGLTGIGLVAFGVWRSRHDRSEGQVAG